MSLKFLYNILKIIGKGVIKHNKNWFTSNNTKININILQ